MIAANMMTSGAVTVTGGAAMGDAVKLLWQKGVALIPVVDTDNKVLGVITPRSVMRLALERRQDAPAFQEFMEGVDKLSSRKIQDAIDIGYASVEPQKSAVEVASIFLDAAEAVEAVLVVDDQKRLLGVIYPSDVLKRLCEYMDRKTEL